MILALDTATPHAGVALLDENTDAVLAVRRARVTTHSEMLLTLVNEALEEAGAAPRDLTAIACGAGPGSFTGLRIGLATAKGLCFALDRPLFLVSSLQALAARAPVAAQALGCLDAFKGEIYAAFYRPGRPQILDGEELVASAERIAELARARLANGALHIIGDAPARWPVLLLPGAIAVDGAPPDPVDIARIAVARVRSGDADDLASAAPRYLRPSEAEVALAKKNHPTS